MSGFWLGVFAGLAVWNLLNAFLAMALSGRSQTIDRGNVLTSFALMVIFMAASWYLATF